ncbi:MAG: hypothetical protein KC416_09420, partial [Myxococcales bacterium]|nr:hypothetical protein [Myxococcales bacterium]
IGHGKILRVADQEIWGSEANAAEVLCRVHAESGQILLTGAAREKAADVEGVTFLELGIAVPGSESNFRVRR